MDRYEEALERAKCLYSQHEVEWRDEDIGYIFPELKKSEDEKIRKALIFHYQGDGCICTNEYRIDFKDIRAWLEKQGSQDNADKPEPKFHESEWITNGDYTWKIVEVKPLDYILQSQDGNIVDDTISHVDEQFHSFTIEDAKDGDVLACENGWTCIFKTLVNDETFSSYCFMDSTKWFCETGSVCHTLKEEFVKAYNGKIYPATKEQRDKLEKAMAEAGYTFDFERKEMKRIIDEKQIKKNLQDNSFRRMFEQNIAWSEEDEELLLKDLSARLPYGTIVSVTDGTIKYKAYIESVSYKNIQVSPVSDSNFTAYTFYKISEIKPYLRPMSSMTEEEKKKFKKLLEEVFMGNMPYISASTSFYDWLNAHHFDYRGLIPMGLALEAKEGMYK